MPSQQKRASEWIYEGRGERSTTPAHLNLIESKIPAVVNWGLLNEHCLCLYLRFFSFLSLLHIFSLFSTFSIIRILLT